MARCGDIEVREEERKLREKFSGVQRALTKPKPLIGRSAKALWTTEREWQERL
jgi:hypothetical protein